METKKDFLDSLEQSLMVVTIIAASCCTFLGFFGQFMSADTVTVLNQLSFYLYGWSIFFALGPSVKRNAFMKIDVIASMYPEAVQKILGIVREILMFVLIALMFAYSIPNLATVIAEGTMNEKAPMIPVALAYAIPVVGYGLGVIAYICRVFTSGKGEK